MVLEAHISDAGLISWDAQCYFKLFAPQEEACICELPLDCGLLCHRGVYDTIVSQDLLPTLRNVCVFPHSPKKMRIT